MHVFPNPVTYIALVPVVCNYFYYIIKIVMIFANYDM